MLLLQPVLSQRLHVYPLRDIQSLTIHLARYTKSWFFSLAQLSRCVRYLLTLSQFLLVPIQIQVQVKSNTSSVCQQLSSNNKLVDLVTSIFAHIICCVQGWVSVFNTKVSFEMTQCQVESKLLQSNALNPFGTQS